MRCGKCSRNKVESLMNYGGVSLCPTCYDDCNPQLHTVNVMTKEVRERLESKKWMLETQLRELKHDLEIDDKIKSKGLEYMTFRTLRN